MLSLVPRGSMQSSSATWPTAHWLPTWDGPMTTASWWRSAGVTRVSWSGPTSPRATGKSDSVTAKSRTSRVRMMEVRDDFVFWIFLCKVSGARICIVPFRHQVMTVTWRGRTRSTTPSRPCPPTCGPWPAWNPTCSSKSPLWTKGISRWSYDEALQGVRGVIVHKSRLLHRDEAKPAFFSQHIFSFPSWNSCPIPALLK